MKFGYKLFSSSLLIVLLLVTGCIFLRLLEVKRQLNDFEDNFRIEEKRGLTLVMLKPVLYSEDLVWLMKNEPVKKENISDGELWKYVLEKQYPVKKREEENFDIPILMLMENGKLTELTFPERFLKHISKSLLARMFRSMGGAEVNKLDRSAGSKFQGEIFQIPKIDNIVSTLGKPYSVKDSDGKYIFVYRYKLKRGESVSNYDEFNLQNTFIFQKSDRRLLRAESHFRGLSMALEFALNRGSK